MAYLKAFEGLGSDQPYEPPRLPALRPTAHGPDGGTGAAKAVACENVLDDAFLATLKSLGIRLIAATYKELRRLGCNLLSLGDRRVMTTGTAAGIDALLSGLGYRVIPIDLSEFVKCGGSVHCLTQTIACDVA